MSISIILQYKTINKHVLFRKSLYFDRTFNSDFDLVSIRYSYSLLCQKFSGASAFNASYLVVSAFHNLLTHSCQLKRTPFIYNADITADLLFIILSVIILKVSPLRSVHYSCIQLTTFSMPLLLPKTIRLLVCVTKLDYTLNKDMFRFLVIYSCYELQDENFTSYCIVFTSICLLMNINLHAFSFHNLIFQVKIVLIEPLKCHSLFVLTSVT